jgi:Phage integrase family
VKKAAEAVLTKEQAKTFTQHDLRHARITQLAETGNLPGVAFIAGHVQASTTSGYIHSNRKAAERTLAIAGATGFSASTPNPTSQRKGLTGVGKSSKLLSLCEGEDLNLHGSYPASTSSCSFLRNHSTKQLNTALKSAGDREDARLFRGQFCGHSSRCGR